MNKLMMGVMYSGKEIFEKCRLALVADYGPIAAESSAYDFDLTHYYDDEMGAGLKKCFIVFERDISKNDLIAIKHRITEIEQQYSVGGSRRINLDPGLLTENGLFLATYKEKGFKEFLGDRVWSHKVLEFREGKAHVFYHTFKDYKLKKDWFEDFIKNFK